MKFWIEAVGILVGLVFFGLLAWMAWPSRYEAESAIQSAGNSDIQLGGWAWFKCAKDDLRGWHFSARNANDIEVHGVVCCGALKGCTVRF